MTLLSWNWRVLNTKAVPSHGVAILKVCDHESFVGLVPSQPNNTLQLALGACNAWEGLSIIMQIMKFHVATVSLY